MIDVEICANSAASARAAKEGGAQRIELCANLECGGLTPSDNDIDYSVRTLGLRTHVLVRPRPGNFCYNAAELAEIESSILRCKALGVHAVVIGFLTAEGKVDLELTRRMVQLAAPMEVTFHRAFDEARQEPLEALRAIADAGCHRLLTSGQMPTAEQGIPLLKELVEQAAGRIIIMPGAGVNPQNAHRILSETGAHEIHGSLRKDGHTDAKLVRAIVEEISHQKEL